MNLTRLSLRIGLISHDVNMFRREWRFSYLCSSPVADLLVDFHRNRQEFLEIDPSHHHGRSKFGVPLAHGNTKFKLLSRHGCEERVNGSLAVVKDNISGLAVAKWMSYKLVKLPLLPVKARK